MPHIDATRPIYIQQINTLRNARTAELFAAMQSDCLPAYQENGLQLLGCWETAPGQGPGPEMVEIWELPSFDAYSKFVAAAHSPKGDPRLRKWFERRSEWIVSMDSMLCISHPATPTVAQLRASGARAKLVVHETVHCEPSRQLDYLDTMYKLWWKPVAEPGGRTLIGLLYSPWNNRRAINIWGVGEEWDNLPVIGTGGNFQSEAFDLWVHQVGHALRDDWVDRFLVPAPFSTIR